MAAAVNQYVILCGCGQPKRHPVLYEAVDGRHVIALIDDVRPVGGSLEVEQNPPENSFTTVKPNRRGDRRSSFNLRCSACNVNLSPIRSSTVRSTFDAIAGQQDLLVAEILRLGWNLVVSIYEQDVPATEADEAILDAKFTAEINGDLYDGPEPTLVPRFSQRLVIPWALFTAAASRLTKDKLR